MGVDDTGFTHKSEPSQNSCNRKTLYGIQSAPWGIDKNGYGYLLSDAPEEEPPTEVTNLAKPTAYKMKQEATPCDEQRTAAMKRGATSRRNRNRKHKRLNASPAAPAREFIVDSGAGFHCVQRSNLSNVELQTLKNTTSIALQTANGMVNANQVVQVYIQELRLKLWALILDNTPCLLSMGRLCRQHGFTFTQEDANPPVLYKGDIRVYCQSTFDVPYITAGSDTQLHDSADVLDEMFPVPDQDSEPTTRRVRPVSEPSDDNLLNGDSSEQEDTLCDTTPHSKRKR